MERAPKGSALRTLRSWHHNYSLTLGSILLSLLLLLLISSFFIDERSAYSISVNTFSPPSWQHWLGTDSLGRDNFSRIAIGARASLAIGAASVLIGGSIGCALGMTAAWFGGLLDLLLVRFLDALKAIPNILLALMIVAVFGRSLPVMIVTISIIAIPLYARMARSATMQIKVLDYIHWARLIGVGNGRILLRHLLPNITAPLMVTASLGFANAVLTEASLSYLGLGVPPPTPSWGRMLSEAPLFNAPWLALSNVAMLTLLVLGFNLLGEGLQRR